ncbi:MAG: recombinase family protein [Clostridia bacterium]|nr:recombinase family protein [Clostridia bacterium]
MAKIRKIEPKIPKAVRRKKVAAYARVSMDTERLMHSVSAQISRYSKLIQSNPEWEYAGVYADMGISGTDIKHRDEMQRLLIDCEAGKIDIVLTKSISRFARNTVDLLSTVRHLKDIGVEVRFEKENISTFSGDGELMLSIIASFAQEESRSISENCKWGIRKRFQTGEAGVSNKHILGYLYNDNKNRYEIIPHEAEIVKRIFDMYIEGCPFRRIADKLNDEGLLNAQGGAFTEQGIKGIILNEAYAGNILRQKTYIENPISKKKLRNKGELPKYLISDCHDAIIDWETYEKVLAEIERRKSLLNPTYTFTGKIKCGICNKNYTRVKSMVKGKTYVRWSCRSKKHGNGCISTNFREDYLYEICSEILETDPFNETVFNETVKQITVLKNGDLEFLMTDGDKRLWKNSHYNSTRHIFSVTDCFKGKIICENCGKVYQRMIEDNHLVYWYCPGKKKGSNCRSKNYADFRLRIISENILGLDEFDEKFFSEQIDCITALEDGSLKFKFYGGRTAIWQKA